MAIVFRAYLDQPGNKTITVQESGSPASYTWELSESGVEKSGFSANAVFIVTCTLEAGYSIEKWRVSGDGYQTYTDNGNSCTIQAKSNGTINVGVNTTYSGSGGGTDPTVYTAIIIFDANGGTGAPETQYFYGTSYSIEVTIPQTIPNRPNYAFLGWNSDKSATEAEFLPGATPTLGATTHTLYAIWKSAGSGGNSSKKVWIYNGSAWVQATPYVYNYDGSDWVWTQAIPYVYVKTITDDLGNLIYINDWVQCK